MKCSTLLLVVLLVLFVHHSTFAARDMQMSSTSKANGINNNEKTNVIDATKKTTSGDHGLSDNKNLVFGGVGSYGGVGGAAGIVGPFGGVGGFGGVGAGAGIGTIGLLPVGGVVGGAGGGVGGGVGGIIP